MKSDSESKATEAMRCQPSVDINLSGLRGLLEAKPAQIGVHQKQRRAEWCGLGAALNGDAVTGAGGKRRR